MVSAVVAREAAATGWGVTEAAIVAVVAAPEVHRAGCAVEMMGVGSQEARTVKMVVEG